MNCQLRENQRDMLHNPSETGCRFISQVLQLTVHFTINSGVYRATRPNNLEGVRNPLNDYNKLVAKIPEMITPFAVLAYGILGIVA